MSPSPILDLPRAGTAEAYEALRSDSAVFERSSTFVRVGGDDAVELLQRAVTRDIDYLVPERSVSGLLLDDDGVAIDAAVVFHLDDHLVVECTHANTDAVLAHLRALGEGLAVEITDRRGELACLAVEGPRAWAVAGRVVAPELAALSLDSVIEAEWRGHPLLFNRGGVTGEYGYKFVADPEVIRDLAVELAGDVAVGDDEVLAMAMLEVRHPHVVPGTTSEQIVEWGAAWLVDPVKDDFSGRDAIHRAHDVAPTISVGFETTGAAPAVGTAVTTADGVTVGRILAAVDRPGDLAPIGLVALDAELACVGLSLRVGDETLRTVASPMVIPLSWKTPIL